MSLFNDFTQSAIGTCTLENVLKMQLDTALGQESAGGGSADAEPQPGPSRAISNLDQKSSASAPSSSSGGSTIRDGPPKNVSKIKEGAEGNGNKATTGTSSPASDQGKDDPPKFELNDKQKADIKEAFNTLDFEGTGFMKTKDLKIALRGLGFEPRKEEIKKLTAQVDKDNTGKLSFSDFSKLVTAKLAEKDCKEEISKAFKLFDRDQSGKITFKNLQQIATELGEGLTEEEITEMITEADLDGDGAVNQDEFFRIMKKTSLY